MPFKWTDSTERMMLVKLLQQNPTIKLDVDSALANWPNDDPPTRRSLTDRFNLIKKQIKDGHHNVNSIDTSNTISTPISIPKTPNLKAKATVKAATNGKTIGKTQSKFKGKITKPIASLAGKRKLSAAQSSEEGSMSEDDNKAGDKSDEDEVSPGSLPRRKLPRRSTTVEASAYNQDDAAKLAGMTFDGGADDFNGSDQVSDPADVDDGDDNSGSDGTFDLAAYRLSGKDSGNNKKVGWRERIAAMDGVEFDPDMMA